MHGAVAAHGESPDQRVFPPVTVTEDVPYIIGKFFSHKASPVSAGVAAVEIKVVSGSRHEHREVILYRHVLGYAPVKPVRIRARESVQKNERPGRTVIMPGLPYFRHFDVIRQHEAEICVLHDRLGMKLHSSGCHICACLS